MTNHIRWLAALSVALLLWSIYAQASELLEAGDRFPVLAAKDQHDHDYRFQAGTRIVLIAFDMGTAKRANRILADKGAEFLTDHSAVYISNIYGMPGVGRFFALPKMRKYPHRIILADSEGLLTPFPREANHVTVIRLDDNAVVQSIGFWNPKQQSLQDFVN